METRAHHLLIGAFTLGLIAAAVLFVLWLGRVSLDRTWAEYDVVFHEAVTGLSLGSVVQYSGIQVGSVTDLRLDADDPSIVIARVRLDGDTPVRTDTRARLTFTGLTGVALIQLTGGSPGAPPLRGEDGAVPRIEAETSVLQTLMTSGEDIVARVNAMLLELTVLLTPENLERVARIVADVERITGSVAARSDALGATLENTTAASAELRGVLARLDAVLGEAEGLLASTRTLIDGDGPDLLASARSTLTAAERAGAGVAELVERNEAAVTAFAERGLGQVGPAVSELRAVLVPLRRLVRRLENNPALLLQGGPVPREHAP